MKNFNASSALFLAGLLALSCSAERNNQRDMPGGMVDDSEVNTEQPHGKSGPASGDLLGDPLPERTLRTKLEYKASIARLFGLRQSDLDEVYQNVEANLPGSSQVTENTVHVEFWTGSAAMAAKGCSLYLEAQKDAVAEASMEETLAKILDMVFLSQEQAEKAQLEIMSLVEMIPAENKAQRLHLGCAAAAATRIFL